MLSVYTRSIWSQKELSLLISYDFYLGKPTTSVPVFALFTELNDGTPLQVAVKNRLSENPAKIGVKLARPMRLQSSKQ